MKVTIAGATGFIGSALTRALVTSGAEVTALVRRPEAARARLPAAVLPVAWDGVAAPPLEALAGADAVVSLVGEPISGIWTTAKKRRIRDSRLAATNSLVSAIAGLAAGDRPRALISGSAVGYYGDRGEEPLTEASSAGSGFLPSVCVDWESAAGRATDFGVRVTTIRTGVVLGRGGMLSPMLPAFKAGLGAPMGSGRQRMPWIHLDDEIELLRRAIEDGSLNGPINAVSPGIVTNADFSRSLARSLGRACLLVVPAFAIKLALGEMSALLLDSQNVIPARLLAAGFAFRHPSLNAALDAILRKPA